MHIFSRTFLGAAVLASALRLTPSIQAQSAVDPSGHWEGHISLPMGDLPIQVDLAKNANGHLAGTFTEPGGKVMGFPISTVTLDGRALTLELNGGRLAGLLLDDGKSINGEFAPEGRIETVPFSLARKGDAHIAAPPKNAPISKAMEGVWKGAIAADGGEFPIVLKMSNQPDGTSIGLMNSVNEGFELPVAIVQQGANLTLDVKALGSSYSGTLNAAGTELVGTYKSPEKALPLTFRRDSGK